MQLEQIIKTKQPIIVDVRTLEEFESGHVPGSMNIPLQQLNENYDYLKSLQQPLLLCCASGGRSGVATQILSSQGIECYNGGSWLSVNFFIS